MKIEVSLGEVLDKLSILEIKNERIKDETRLQHVKVELKYLKEKLKRERIYYVQELYNELKQINEELWDIEDFMREKYNKNEIDEDYTKKMVYDVILNDKRFLVKSKINNISDSRLKEQKSYENLK